ncbi:amino acid adenylation domain-containing protein [Streptomyces sp. NPDC058440]|uniref:amino acid adenylation domain-containing protein n=1 Tax=Streptomyces sp. NPDC058440 TaxID=3346501 RepID=UPI00366A34D9
MPNRRSRPAPAPTGFAPARVPPSPGSRIPLTGIQEQLWFLDQAFPNRATYNNMLTLRLEGALDAEALEAALTEVVRRHGALRTTFPAVDGRPHQAVGRPERVTLRQVTVADHTPAGREAEAKRIIEDEQLRPYDLARGPLVRFVLVRMGERDNVLAVALHHIISDAGTFAVLSREISHYYAVFALGDTSVDGEHPYQYVDFAVEQAERVASGALDEGVNFWREALETAPPYLEWAAGGSRTGAAPDDSSGAVDFTLNEQLTDDLVELGIENASSLFMTLMAAFGVLVSRYTADRRRTVTVGVPFDIRPEVGLQDAVGLFINALPIPLHCLDHLSFSELVQQARDMVLEAHAHRDIPLERLVEELTPQREFGRNPLFQVLFQLQYEQADEQKNDQVVGLRMTPFKAAEPPAKFDITLSMSHSAGRLAGHFNYASALFGPDEAESMVEQFERLLTAAVAEPGKPLRDLDMAPGYELHGAAEEWNATSVHVSASTVPGLFEEQVRRSPERTALVFEDISLSFAELNARADRFARELVRRGIGPGRTVAVALPRSPELVVALLGALKAGARYLPIDTDLPGARIAWMLEDSGCALLVCDGKLPLDSDGPPVPRLPVDDVSSEDPGDSAPDVRQPAPDDPAYVIYTSGSTGTPKAVTIAHSAVVNRLLWMGAELGLGSDDVVLQKTPIGFDVSVGELFQPLVTGARLVLAAPGRHGDPRYLSRLIREQGITTVHFVPSMLRAFLQNRDASSCASLRRVICSGEELPVSLVEEFYALLHIPLFNLYGPTETTIEVSHHLTEPGGADARVPIGRPVWNTQLHVLDDELRPVPCGTVGELHVGGAQVAWGYEGLSGQTAACFVPDPFGSPGSRLYRTGDLARRRTDGSIEYLGRVDDQVKVHGVRVEPGEIEEALCAHPAVAEAAVTTFLDAFGDRYLVAYYVSNSEDGQQGERSGYPAPESAALALRLTRVLPTALVPSRFVLLESLPRTASGKLDRRALPMPAAAQAGSGPAAEPGTPQEKVICLLMAGLLGRAPVGAHESFFALGGHSLLAIRLSAGIQGAFGVELSLRTVFQSPTPAGLAAAVAAARGAPARPPLRHLPSDGPFPLSPAQRWVWFSEQLAGRSSDYHMPWAVRLRGRLDRAALAAAFEDLVRRHDSLRTVFPATEEEPHQLVREPGAEGLPRLVVVDTTDEGLAVDLDAAVRAPFDLADGPTARFRLFVLAPDEHVLLVVQHHLCADGWSYRPLTRDLSVAYVARAEGRELDWEPLPVTYADYVRWHGEVLGSTDDPDSRMAQLASFWRSELAGLPDGLELPPDRPRPVHPSEAMDYAPVVVPAELHAGVVRLAGEHQASVHMVLQAAIATLLGAAGAGADIAIGTPALGRDDERLMDHVGMFVNLLLLRIRTTGDPTFAELLDRVRGSCLNVYAHQDIPFVNLAGMVAPDHAGVRRPLFEVVLSLQPAAVHGWSLPGLATSEVEVPPTGTRQKLTFELLEYRDAEGGPSGIEGRLVHPTEWIEPATADRLVTRLARLLEAAVADPGRRLSELTRPQARERDWLVHGLNPTPEAETGRLLVHEQVAAASRRNPHSTALVTGSGCVSYGELDRRVNRLARLLLRLGLGRDRTVGVFLERGPQVVVAMLAILKAGGCYVPLDSMNPPERLELMLGDAAPSWILTESALRDRLPAARAGVLALDELADELESLPQDPPDVTVHMDDLAYLCFTSGSTGRPKGVMVQHGTIAERVGWRVKAYGLTPDDRALALAPIGFDLSVWEILAAVAAGSMLAFVPEGADPAAVAARIADERITVLETVPSLLRMLLQDHAQELGTLRHVVSVGDVFPLDMAVTGRAVLPNARFHNTYGPTEAGVICSWWPLQADEWGATVPIGHPIDATRLYVLDEHLELVAAGDPGELCIGGIGVARGYCGPARLTAERFVPDPFGGAGERLYRTGDLVRRRVDGALEFLGRADQQIKIRGFRVEPGEVEAVLGGLDTVAEAAVVVGKDGFDEQILVAHVVPAGAPPTAVELIGQLKDRIPDYLVPSRFHFTDRLPRSINGKLDRNALRVTAPDPSSSSRVPATDREKALCVMMADLLGLPELGPDDNFFALGGHSLLVVRLRQRIRSELSAELSVRSIMTGPTPAGIEAALARLENQGPTTVEQL